MSATIIETKKLVESAQKEKDDTVVFVSSHILNFSSSILLVSEGKTPTDHFFFVPSCDKRGDSNGPGKYN